MDKTFKLGDKVINRIGFGAMRVTGDGIWGEPQDHDAAIDVLRKTVELGINFIDTADAYGPEVSENLLKEALYPYNDRLVIATKGGQTRSGPGEWNPDGRPEHLRKACEASLQRLGLQQIELYQLHRVDPAVPLTESVGTLFELQKEGKVKHVGLSNVSVEQLQQALDMGEIASVQNRYSLFDRDNEDVLKFCEEHGIMFIPWYPIGGGTGFAEEILKKVADKHGATERQVGIAWLLQHSPVMVPIPGTGSVEHLEENMKAADLELDAEDINKLDGISA